MIDLSKVPRPIQQIEKEIDALREKDRLHFVVKFELESEIKAKDARIAELQDMLCQKVKVIHARGKEISSLQEQCIALFSRDTKLEAALRRSIKALHITNDVIATSPAVEDTIFLPKKYDASIIGCTLYDFIGHEIEEARKELKTEGGRRQ